MILWFQGAQGGDDNCAPVPRINYSWRIETLSLYAGLYICIGLRYIPAEESSTGVPGECTHFYYYIDDFLGSLATLDDVVTLFFLFHSFYPSGETLSGKILAYSINLTIASLSLWLRGSTW